MTHWLRSGLTLAVAFVLIGTAASVEEPAKKADKGKDKPPTFKVEKGPFKVEVALKGVFEADSVVLGGGNGKQLRRLPPGVRLGHNNAAFRGGFRLWGVEDVPVLTAGGQSSATVPQTEWRLI